MRIGTQIRLAALGGRGVGRLHMSDAEADAFRKIVQTGAAAHGATVTFEETRRPDNRPRPTIPAIKASR